MRFTLGAGGARPPSHTGPLRIAEAAPPPRPGGAGGRAARGAGRHVAKGPRPPPGRTGTSAARRAERTDMPTGPDATLLRPFRRRYRGAWRPSDALAWLDDPRAVGPSGAPAPTRDLDRLRNEVYGGQRGST